MSDLVELDGITELTDGAMKVITIKGHEILVARVGDIFYAADNRCPHMGGKLSQGNLEGTIVTCPRHGSQFDLSDGHVVRWLKSSGLIWKLGRALKSPRPIVTYNIKFEEDRISIEI